MNRLHAHRPGPVDGGLLVPTLGGLILSLESTHTAYIKSSALRCYPFRRHTTDGTEPTCISRRSFPSTTAITLTSPTLGLFTNSRNSRIFSSVIPYLWYNRLLSEDSGTDLISSNSWLSRADVRCPGGGFEVRSSVSFRLDCNVR